MADDAMSKFKEYFPPRPAAPAAELVVNRPGQKPPYAAHKHKDKVSRLDVRCKNGLEYSIGYTYITTVSSTWRENSEILVVGAGLIVSIKGRGLGPIAKAIKEGTCVFVHEFSEDDFAPPEEATAPYIDSINVRVKGAERAEGEEAA